MNSATTCSATWSFYMEVQSHSPPSASRSLLTRLLAEAEYAAASYSCKEVAFVRNVCSELDLDLLHGPVCLAVDNEAAIKIAENRGVTGRTKHFSDAIHYVRHMLDHLLVRVRYVSTVHQLADGFTKPLEKAKFRAWCSRLLCGVGDEHL